MSAPYLLRQETYYISDIHPHSFIIKNYSPTVDFGLYHSEEGPPEVEHAGISVNILQPGVRKILPSILRNVNLLDRTELTNRSCAL